ncbi:MAG TPA: DNA polymerase IV [Candidatus Deferrimicrobium sp.]|nr:DNA polymerase IV [Candidatus Deferrimicrobium sp.]
MSVWENEKKIIHVDMDAFYASVEQRDNPELRGKPVVVGGSPQSRGVASTCSYEARKYGIRSAMPLAEAYRRCPHAIFVPVNGRKYREVSLQINKIFHDYTPLVEPLSLDEAFLDVTGSTRLFGSAERIATEIKARIQEEINLTASVGLACNKFLAKIASDLKKPNGFVVVAPDRIQQFLDPLPVERIWGVGVKTAERLHGLNIRRVRELRQLDMEFLERLFGIGGKQLYLLARGIDERPVEVERGVKSIGREITFSEDIRDREALATFLLELTVDVGRKLRKEALKARTINLKLRFKDFSTITRARTLDSLTNLDDVIFANSSELLQEVVLKDSVRLIGVSVSNLSDQEESQLSLFAEPKQEKENLTKTVDLLKERFGEKSIIRARLLGKKKEH